MLYPLKFKPILKEKIWGGDKLKTILGKPVVKPNTGESWEIATVGNDVSIVSNGSFKGQSLTALIKEYKGALLGEHIYQQFGDQFPLLLKFIDAREDLSVQLHPDDVLAKERHNSLGKTEMWYVVQADPDARLIIDFNTKISKEEYENHVAQGTLIEVLKEENIKAGDSFFIEAGRIHAIGAGTLIAEIQETSDITYRIYDWDRVDTDGNARTLHTESAMEALKYDFQASARLTYQCVENTINEIVTCSHFTTNFLTITARLELNSETTDSFKAYMCMKGSGIITCNGYIEQIHKGETILVPANSEKIIIEGIALELLEVYIKI